MVSQGTDSFMVALSRSLDPDAQAEFGQAEQWLLKRSMADCQMVEYPQVTGDPNGERTSGDMVCEVCGQQYVAHPLDWRVIGHGNVPFLNVLCDGRRVKL